jgi:Fe-Mn family superoxide dismutase
MAFELPKLSYGFADLEPHYDAATVELHYTKHHATYAANFTKAAEAAGLAGKTAEEILTNLCSTPDGQKSALTNHGGGYWNHNFFWESLAPAGSDANEPDGKLGAAIKLKWGGFEQFKEAFSAKALAHFGSGWAWLVRNSAGALEIIDTHDQVCPLTLGYQPLICIDVWEHAYYLHFKNVRANWIASWWNIANWRKAEERFETAQD